MKDAHGLRGSAYAKASNIGFRPYLHQFNQLRMAPVKPLHEQDEDVDVLDDTGNAYSLIVWNDHVNTFEWVIETLVDVCDHTYEQAEQCAYIIHHQGKYAVKHGSYDFLKPKCEAITDRGIGATIESRG